MVGRGINHKKLITRAISLAMVLTLLPTQAFATDITIRPDIQLKVAQPGSGKSDAILSAEASSFNVTVPTILPITVDADGNTFTSKEAKIINSSSGPVKVNSLEVIPQNGWELVSYETDFRLSKIDTKEYGIQFNGVNIPTTGIADSLNWSTMAKDTELPILYDANISPQSNILTDIEIARVIFTIGWDEADLDFELNTPTLSLEKGNTGRIELIGVKEAKWGSDNEAIATVDQTGLVTAISWGTTDITAEANGITHRCEVTIPKVLTGITLNQTTATLTKGETLQLTVTPQYRGGIIWESSNNSVATVDQTGLVTSIETGAVVITATAGEFSGKCDIEVVESSGGEGEYILAKDSDFSGTTNGTFKYIGTDDYVEIPHVIKGVPITHYSNMFSGANVKGVKNTNTNVTNMGSMFSKCKSTELELIELNTSNVTNMSNMFGYCEATTLDLSSFNTTNVTNMSNMFYRCRATKIDLSGFNTSKVTIMKGMFDGCMVNTLELSSFNTSKVINMQDMFFACEATKLNTSSFDTSSVINMEGMFLGCKVNTLDLSNFDTSNVTNTVGMFKGCLATTGYAKTQSDANKLNASSERPSTLRFIVKPPVSGETYTEGNYEYTYGKVKLDGQIIADMPQEHMGWHVSVIDKTQTSYAQPLEEINGQPVTSYYCLFYQYPNTTLTLEGTWTNRNVTSMRGMFWVNKAKNLNLSNFKTDSVTNMDVMFNRCEANILDLRSFNTSNVTTMQSMFSDGCLATVINTSSFNTSNVTDMSYMFRDVIADRLELSNFDTSNVTDMRLMFEACKSTSINLKSFNTSKVTDMTQMFQNCKVNTLDISSFNTSNVTDMHQMFTNSLVTTLDLSSFDTSSVTNMNSMFNGSKATTGYARTQAEANKFNSIAWKPSTLNFIVKPINKIVALEVV